MTSDVLTAFSPGAEFLAVATPDGRVKVYEFPTSQFVVTPACW
jgi:hypothetical protein